jgi:Holliday junction resolvasome RuvABC endonuclease subunit
MKILALDIATHCGWCTETAHGVWDLSIKRDESSGMRLIRFKHKLKEIFKLEEITLVAFERTSGQHKNALIVQAELHGVLKSLCEESNIDYRAFSASEIKKFATGKGNAKKADMIEAAQVKLGMIGDDDNEADAMWIYEVMKSSLSL